MVATLAGAPGDWLWAWACVKALRPAETLELTNEERSDCDRETGRGGGGVDILVVLVGGVRSMETEGQFPRRGHQFSVRVNERQRNCRTQRKNIQRLIGSYWQFSVPYHIFGATLRDILSTFLQIINRYVEP